MPASIYNFPSHLAPQLVPSSAWGQNLRAVLTPSAWQKVRLAAIAKYGHACKFCGAKPKSLDCHEIWTFETNDGDTVETFMTGVQRLKAIYPLCKACHQVCHIGFWSLQGQDKYNQVVRHFMKVRKIDHVTATKEISAAFTLHDMMSRIEWSLDQSSFGNI